MPYSSTAPRAVLGSPISKWPTCHFPPSAFNGRVSREYANNPLMPLRQILSERGNGRSDCPKKNRNLARAKKKSRGTFFLVETAQARIFNFRTTISDILIVTFPFLAIMISEQYFLCLNMLWKLLYFVSKARRKQKKLVHLF